MAKRPAPTDISEYTPFGDVARDRCGMQCQYACRYLAGEHGSPDLGSDLRWYGDTASYHGLNIHRDDAAVFVRRAREYRLANGIGWSGETRA
jgi:hypothetical protein